MGCKNIESTFKREIIFELLEAKFAGIALASLELAETSS
jgi:hypothetical protein